MRRFQNPSAGPTPAAFATLAAIAALTSFALAPRTAEAQSGSILDRMRERAAERAQSQTENEAGERVDSAVDKTVDCAFNPIECAKKAPAPGTTPTSTQTPPAGTPGATPAADATEWYAESQGKRVGPMPRGELDALVTRGEVKPETLVWREGMSGWTAAGSVDELAPAFKKVPPPLPPQRSGPPPLPSR
ncbi:MAG: DUF4339 domain-containing protein [Deltaproteobacteria bacterium]|nr:DUF4339 domain-containing protein [Deltaproteobacteria bacterium]